MKIRTDFVTNSSSVSYIITMCEDIVNIYAGNIKPDRDAKMHRIVNYLIDDIKRNGTCLYIEGKEILTRRIKFDDGGDCLDDDSFDKPIEEVDFSRISNEDLWAYILGEYIVGGKISYIRGFGATMIETY